MPTFPAYNSFILASIFLPSPFIHIGGDSQNFSPWSGLDLKEPNWRSISLSKNWGVEKCMFLVIGSLMGLVSGRSEVIRNWLAFNLFAMQANNASSGIKYVIMGIS